MEEVRLIYVCCYWLISMIRIVSAQMSEIMNEQEIALFSLIEYLKSFVRRPNGKRPDIAIMSQTTYL